MLERCNEILKKHHAVGGWVLILAATAIFQGVLSCGFVLDDIVLILQNPFIKNVHFWRHIFVAPMWAFMGHAAQGGFYRPLGVFLFWLICRVSGLNPGGYHFFQLFLYAAAVWMVYRIGRKLLPSELAAFAGALLWTLHPSHVEAVAWASAIPDIACGLFCLFGFWFFLRAEAQSPPRFRDHALAAAIYFPALFCKELAFTFPLLILTYWFCFSRGGAWLQRALHWVPYVAAVGICAVVRVSVMGQFGATSVFRGFRPPVAWVAIGLMGEHAKVFFWPVHLSEFRDFTLAAILRSPWPWVTLVVVALAAVMRKKDPLLSFLVLWWFVMLLPCFDYRQLSFPLVEDQFSYLPSVGLCLALAYLVFDRVPKFFANPRVAAAAAGALTIVAALWAVQTARAIPHWSDQDALIKYSLRVSPNAALVHISHGVDLQFRDHDLDGAAREFRTALELNAQSLRPLPHVTYHAYIGLGQVALLQGREGESLQFFHKAVHLFPHYNFAYNVLGSVYFPRGDYARAADYFRLAVEMNPMDVSARFYLGTCWKKLGKPVQAAEQFHEAREVDPEYDQAYVAEAAALQAAGDTTGAAHVRQALARR